MCRNILKYTIFIFFVASISPGCNRRLSDLQTEPDNSNPFVGAFWEVSEEKHGGFPCQSDFSVPNRYRLVQPDTSYVFGQLRNSKGLTDTITVQLPMSDGSLVFARLSRSASVPLEFDSKYGISAYSGKVSGLDGSMVRLEKDPKKGLRLMVLYESRTSLLLQVCNQVPWHYVVFEKNDLPAGAKTGFE